jgi:CDP-4-dehydro-6-deoxyglucose reductase
MKVTLQPAGHVLDLLPGERILDAARRLGFDAPQSCRNGNCYVCNAQLLHGLVLQNDEPLTSGEILTCMAIPQADCEVFWEHVLAPNQLRQHTVACQVAACEPIGADVWQVNLRPPAGKPLRYHAGQYLLLNRPDGEATPFSIASAPHQERTLELHILARDPVTEALIEQMRREGIAHVQVPFGDCHLATLPDRPLVLIAAGTGLSQMQSIIEHCLEQRFAYPIHLYWGVRHGDDLYAAAHWKRWEEQKNLILHRIVSDHPDWPGRKGMLHQAIKDDLGDLSEYEFYVSGSPPMVYGTLDALVESGMPAAQMHADVFAYAPRD